MAGSRRSAHVSRPKRAWASPQERTAPGTVTVQGPMTGIASRPAARAASRVAPAADRPLPFSAWRRGASGTAEVSASRRNPAPGQMSQNASPPKPQA